MGFVYEAPTWRASADWGALLGYDEAALRSVNRRAIEFLAELQSAAGGESVVSGCIGPRGDAYQPESVDERGGGPRLSPTQIETFGAAGADMVNAMTITYPDEAIGIVQAAGDVGMPVSVSFTLETDGRLPDGSPLADAIRMTDEATDAGRRLFHGQLRASHAHRAGAFRWRRLDKPRARYPGECVAAQPRRTRRGSRPRRR